MVSRRIDKVNKQIQRVVGELIQTEVDLDRAILVTVAQVETTPNLAAATVWLSIYPAEQAKPLLAELTSKMYGLQGAFNRAVTLQPIPRLTFKLHHGAERAEEIARRLADLAD